MPTTVVKTIRASGGDYTTLTAWEAANQGNLVTADEIRVAECYNDWPSGLDDKLVIDGSTTDATRYLMITVAAGHRHTGIPQSGFYVKKNVGFDTLIRDSDPYTRLAWLDIENTNSNGQALYANAGSGVYGNLIAKTAGTSQYVVGLYANGITVHGTLAYGSGTGFQINTSVAANIYNSVATGCANGFKTGSTNAVLKNCVAYNNTTNYSGTFSAASTNNATSSASDDAPGDSSVVGITSADFVNAASNDFHLAAGSALIGAGTNLYSVFTADIDGDAWPSSGAWDIGFDSYGSGGGSSVDLSSVAQAQASASGGLSVDSPPGEVSLAGSAAAQASASGRVSVEPRAWEFVGSAAANVASGDVTLALPTAGPTPTWSGADYNPVLGLFVAVGQYGSIMTSPDGVTWAPSQSGTGRTLNNVCHRPSDGLLVAVGLGGVILTSDDGKGWVVQTSGTSADIYGVCYSEADGLFVAVGYLGLIRTSPDGVTWTSRSSGVTSILYSVVAGDGIIVATGSSGAIVSSPTGVTWTVRTGAWSSAIYAVTYGAGLFVACSLGVFLTSPTGETWTQRTSSIPGYTRGIIYVAADGLYVAVATSGEVVTSPNGIDWTTRSTGNTNGLRAIAYSPDSDVFAVAGILDTRMTSADTLSWTDRTPVWSGLQAGDLLVAMISYRDSAAFALPAGWALVATQQSGGNISDVPADSVASGLMAYCVRGAADPDLVFSRAGGDVATAIAAVYRPM